MAEVLESRSFKISDRIVTLSNVRSLAKVLVENVEATLKVEGRSLPAVEFSAECDDGSTFQSSDIELFAEDSIVAKKRVIEVLLAYRHYAAGSRVSVRLRHASRTGNSVTVEGTDSNWVNGTVRSLQETIESFAPQTKPIFFRHKLLLVFVSYGFGRVLSLAASLVVTPSSAAEPSPWFKALNAFVAANPLFAAPVEFLFLAAIGSGFLVSCLLWVSNLWPPIELQIGPDHTRLEKKRRSFVSALWTLAIVPLLLSIAYDLLKQSVGAPLR